MTSYWTRSVSTGGPSPHAFSRSPIRGPGRHRTSRPYSASSNVTALSNPAPPCAPGSGYQIPAIEVDRDVHLAVNSGQLAGWSGDLAIGPEETAAAPCLAHAGHGGVAPDDMGSSGSAVRTAPAMP